MTEHDRPELVVVEDDQGDELPPPTPHQRSIREALRAELAAELRPIRETWDARSRDMLDVLAEASDARVQVRAAARTIKVAAWLGVASLVGSGLLIWQVLERERDDRRAFRESEQIRRLEAAQLIIDAGREDVRKIDARVRAPCPR